MGITEIVLLIIGGILFAAGFVIPEKKTDSAADLRQAAERIKELAQSSMEQAKQNMEELAEETAGVVMERTERSLEKLSNEKMMAVSEYSDTVLQEINHNHEEVMFLYDMLSDKQEEIKSSVQEVTVSAKEALENATDARIVSQEADELARRLRLDMEDIELKARNAGELAGKAVDEAEALYAAVQAAEVQPAGTLQESVLQESSLQEAALQEVAVKNTEPVTEEEAAAPETEITVEEAPEIKKGYEKKSPEKKSASRKKAVKEPEKDGTNANMDIQFASGDERANNNELILSMHKQGKSNMAIAKELGLGLGEVKLVIDLFEGI